MKLYRTSLGPLLEEGSSKNLLHGVCWEEILGQDSPVEFLSRIDRRPVSTGEFEEAEILSPATNHEVWAAGVTYLRSRDARVEESETAGGGDFYLRVYHAERPELFLKAAPGRTVGPGAAVRIRRDSEWSVPEPELTVLVAPSGRITGYTVGNDVSARDIEGENPLYLPQAKIYDGSCALGPGILLQEEPLPPESRIRLRVLQNGTERMKAETRLAQMKRTPEELARFLCRECSFPAGCFLMTGTGVVPAADFALAPGDEVEITIDSIGRLVNRVETLRTRPGRSC